MRQYWELVGELFWNPLCDNGRASTPIAKLRIELAEADLLKAKLGASAASGAKSSLQKVSESLAK
eukprot:3463020-Amphidinium_carterae.1